MPLYEYRCEACGKRFEVIQKFSDAAPDACRLCGKGPVQRQMSSPAIQFKGSGWYITDYAKKSGSDAGSSSSGGSDPKTDTKTDTKTESKSETKPDAPAKSETPARSAASSPKE